MNNGSVFGFEDEALKTKCTMKTCPFIIAHCSLLIIHCYDLD